MSEPANPPQIDSRGPGSPIIRRISPNVLYIACFTALALIVASVVWWFQLRGGPVTTITTVHEWNAATASGNCILFVDCGWNYDVVAFRQPWERFVNEQYPFSDIHFLTMTMDTDESSDVWKICEKLWNDNGISSGGMKNMNGAGRVVWIKNGSVVHCAWCDHLFNRADWEDVEVLRSITADVF